MAIFFRYQAVRKYSYEALFFAMWKLLLRRSRLRLGQPKLITSDVRLRIPFLGHEKLKSFSSSSSLCFVTRNRLIRSKRDFCKSEKDLFEFDDVSSNRSDFFFTSLIHFFLLLFFPRKGEKFAMRNKNLFRPRSIECSQYKKKLVTIKKAFSLFAFSSLFKMFCLFTFMARTRDEYSSGTEPTLSGETFFFYERRTKRKKEKKKRREQFRGTKKKLGGEKNNKKIFAYTIQRCPLNMDTFIGALLSGI